MEIYYQQTCVQVITNQFASEPFELHCSTCQGVSIFSAMFELVLEYLAILIRQSNHITLLGFDYKLFLYAKMDISAILDKLANSLTNIIQAVLLSILDVRLTGYVFFISFMVVSGNTSLHQIKKNIHFQFASNLGNSLLI